MKLETLRDLMCHELQDIYDAEHQMTEALPLMEKAASAPDLKRAFSEHLARTEAHIARLEQVFQRLGAPAKRQACAGMKGIITEGQKMMNENADPDVMDAGLIAAAQKVEHYEIAAYGTVRTYAAQMGDQEVCALLQATLDEEGATDKRLTAIAEGHVNLDAAGTRMAA
jgi:ferritin-like metal-binding protein YciE